MNCININHPEYKSLLNSTKEHPHVLNYKISLWMDKNGTDSFPTANEVLSIPFGQGVFYNINPIKQLGIKYNMNQGGFMPANVDLAQVQRDARKLNLTVHRAASRMWFFKDSSKRFINPFKYRQLETSTPLNPNQDLTDRLLKWANTHGIAVTTLEEMMNRATDSDSLKGSVAVADLLNRIIAIDPQKEGYDTLAEEVAHFATSILKDDVSVKKAMEKIVDTEMYKEVKEVYAELYNNEEDFRKEAVDKLLTQVILDKFQETKETKGVLPFIKGIFSKFKKWVSKFRKSDAAEEIKNDLYPLAQSILNNEYLGTANTVDATSNTVFYQKGLVYTPESETELLESLPESIEKVKAKFVIAATNKLNERLEQLRRNSAKAKKVKSLQKEIDTLKEQIEKNELTVSALGVIELARKELVPINKMLDTFIEKNATNGKDLEMIEKFSEMYQNLFTDFQEGMSVLNFSKEENKNLLNMLQEVRAEILQMDSRNRALIKENALTVLEEGNIGPDGQKIDPDFNAETAFNFTKEDASAWRLQVGNYKLSNSAIIRAVHKILFDATQAVKRFAISKGNVLLRAQLEMENAGVKVEDLIEKDANGKYTQYLIRKEDWAGYYAERSKMQEKLAKELGYDSYADLDTSQLSEKDLKTYKRVTKAFFKENSFLSYDSEGTIIGRKPKTLNPKFAELMKNPAVKNYYDLLIDTKTEALSKLPTQYRTSASIYLLPGIRAQFLEKLTDNNQSFLTNMRETVKEAFFIDEDDTQFGEISALNNRMVPIYFNQRFDNPANLSRDLTRSYTVYSEMAENFKSMNTIAGDVYTVSSALSRRKYQKGKQQVEGIVSRDFKILQNMLDQHVYGIVKKDVSVTVKDTPLTRKLHLANKSFSFTKLAQKVSKYISLNNLALNPFTSTAAYLKGSIDSTIEDQIGLYTTIESKNWAIKEYAKNILHVLQEVFTKRQTNKMHLILQRNGVVELNKMLRNTNKNKLLSDVTSRDLMYLNYRTADYAIKGRVALAIYDNLRLVDGNFINKKDFLEKSEKEGISKKEANKKWKEYRNKSLYNAYEVVDGILQVKPEFKKYVTDGVENMAVGRVSHVANTVDGTLSESDKGALARTVYGDFVLMHRGWFITMMDSRFTKKKVNFITGEEEMGIYPAAGDFIYQDIIKGKNLTPWDIYSAYKNIASPAKKRGVKKATLDLIYLQVVALISAMVNVAADDDDENMMLQLAAYQMNRVLLEQAAGQPLLNTGELLQIIDEPVVGVRTVKDLLDIKEIFNFKPYQSGMYKGWTHAGKWAIKKIPGYKNIYESQFPDLKNNFLKNQIIDSYTYDLLKEKQDDSEFTLLERLALIFKDQQPDNESTVVQYIEALEEDNY